MESSLPRSIDQQMIAVFETDCARKPDFMQTKER